MDRHRRSGRVPHRGGLFFGTQIRAKPGGVRTGQSNLWSDWLVHGQKGDEGPLRVRVGGRVGPGTHVGKIGKSAGNDCDAIVGPVANLVTHYGGTYVAMVDKAQRPVCVAQSRLILSTFTQKLSVGLSKDISGVTRESTTDAMQKRLDLEVATQVNRYLHPGKALPEAAMSRHGRCSDGFRTFVGN